MRIPEKFWATPRRLLAGSLFVMVLAGCRSSAVRSTAAEGLADRKAVVAAIPMHQSNRLVYPWSVVSGGVDSPLAILEAMQGDPVVEEHYAGLNPAAFTAEVVPAKRQGYVSYRIRDKIYWTRRMVSIQAGETMLTDGRTIIRGRCGNLISATPREPVAAQNVEPEEPAMDRPAPEVQLMYSPPVPERPVTETGSMTNPMRIGTDPELTAVLKRPDANDVLPPVWTAGHRGTRDAIIGGVAGSGGGSGGTLPLPGSPVPAPSGGPEVGMPGTLVIPAGTGMQRIEAPQPLIIPSLLPPPSNPNSPVGYTPPDFMWNHPGTSTILPGIPIPPVALPPVSTPPQITHPPPGSPPPGSPPPVAPPPSGPTPFDPPASDPSSSSPEDQPIPEPGPWILFTLGLAGLAVGSIRRKY